MARWVPVHRAEEQEEGKTESQTGSPPHLSSTGQGVGDQQAEKKGDAAANSTANEMKHEVVSSGNRDHRADGAEGEQPAVASYLAVAKAHLDTSSGDAAKGKAAEHGNMRKKTNMNKQKTNTQTKE